VSEVRNRLERIDPSQYADVIGDPEKLKFVRRWIHGNEQRSRFWRRSMR
jgi:hypothetical protein